MYQKVKSAMGIDRLIKDIEDIESIKDVHFVMKEGEIIRNDND